MADEITIASAPAATTTASVPVTTEAPVAPAGLLSRNETIARSIAAGKVASAAPVATADAIPTPPPVPGLPAAVVEPKPSETTAKPVQEAPKDDPMAAVLARIEATEKHNAELLKQMAELRAAKTEPQKPEPIAKPDEPRALTDSPFEAQAKMYFGDLPKPLVAAATDAMEKRYGWQLELRAAESAAQAGDATAQARVRDAQTALVKVQSKIERIEFDAAVAKQSQAPQLATISWGVLAREELVDGALADRASWKPAYQALEDHEVAAVLRAVPAGESLQDYAARAEKALDSYVAKRQTTTHAPPSPAQSTTTAPRNPAPTAPAKVETAISGDIWSNDKLPTQSEKVRRIVSRGRGDAQTN